MTTADLSYVVAEHRRALPEGSYVRLGACFLRRYHATYLRTPGAVALVGELDGRTVGFLVGVTDAALHRQALKHALPGLLASAALAFLRRPPLLWQMLRSPTAASYLRRATHILRPRQAVWSPSPQSAVLTYLAVSAAARGSGIGDGLLAAFLDCARGQGCAKVTLVTEPGSDGSADYYARRGWTKEHVEHTPTGRELQVMAWSWPPAA